MPLLVLQDHAAAATETEPSAPIAEVKRFGTRIACYATHALHASACFAGAR